jgi:anti-sigma regulatory factor (Ser/Thr protein kinase)
MDPDVIASLVLCVAEISANSVEHGAGYGTVSVWTRDNELICEVADPGGGFEQPYPGYLPPEEGSLRGYGLWIARQLSDLMEVRTREGISRIRLHMTI